MLIDAQNLELMIGGHRILEGVSLHIEAGEIYGLLGPNGAGKTTTIFTLLGLYRRDAGDLTVLGADPNRNAVDIRRDIGLVPERVGLYQWMTSEEYLRWHSGLYGLDADRERLGGLLEQVGLAWVGDRRIGHYSHGMRQRLALARALLHEPKLLVLDEPTNGLDPRGRREIHDLLLSLAKERLAGILLCTHLLDDVDRLCQRIGIINEGRTVLEGPLNELLVTRAAGQNYRVRLDAPPSTSALPPGVSLLGHEAGWWHVHLQTGAHAPVPSLWRELLNDGWRITEIQAEGGGLEELYLHMTADGARVRREVTT